MCQLVLFLQIIGVCDMTIHITYWDNMHFSTFSKSNWKTSTNTIYNCKNTHRHCIDFCLTHICHWIVDLITNVAILSYPYDCFSPSHHLFSSLSPAHFL